MLAGRWPEYPFDWPPPGAANLRRKRVHPEMIDLIRKAIAVQPRSRFASAVRLQSHFEKVYPKALRHWQRSRK